MSTATPRPISEIIAAMTSNEAADTDLVTRAYDFAQKAHEGQKRYSGAPYFTHCAEVGFLLAQAGMDAPAIAAGLLHDTIEDAGVKAGTKEEKVSKEGLPPVARG